LAARSKIKCENDIKGDLRILKMNNWTIYIQDRVKWKVVVEKAKTFQQCLKKKQKSFKYSTILTL
jgi:hypothetical protein